VLAAQPSPKAGAPTQYSAVCPLACLIVARARLDQGSTWRQLKRRLILQGQQRALPALERVRAAA
jgi:hypothetical protein